MALTADVKEELARVEVPKTDACGRPSSPSLLRFSGGLHSSRAASPSRRSSTRRRIARRVTRDLVRALRRAPRVSVISPSGHPALATQLPRARASTAARRSHARPACSTQRRRPVRGLPNKLTTGSRDDLAAIWRGAFLAARHAHRSGPLGRARDHLPRQRGGDGARRRGRPPRHLREGPRGARRAPRRHPRRRGDQRRCSRSMGADRHRARLGGAAPAPRGARQAQPPRELRRREPAPLRAGRRRRLRARRARPRDPRRRRPRAPARTRASCASRTATRASTSSATTPTRR